MAESDVEHEKEIKQTVKKDFGKYKVWINKDCFFHCWSKIWQWIDVGALTGQLMKHGLVNGPQDFFLIHADRGPRDRADNLLYKLTERAGEYGYYLLYVCIRDCDENRYGHSDVVKELKAYAEKNHIQPPPELADDHRRPPDGRGGSSSGAVERGSSRQPSTATQPTPHPSSQPSSAYGTSRSARPRQQPHPAQPQSGGASGQPVQPRGIIQGQGQLINAGFHRPTNNPQSQNPPLLGPQSQLTGAQQRTIMVAVQESTAWSNSHQLPSDVERDAPVGQDHAPVGQDHAQTPLLTQATSAGPQILAVPERVEQLIKKREFREIVRNYSHEFEIEFADPRMCQNKDDFLMTVFQFAAACLNSRHIQKCRLGFFIAGVYAEMEEEPYKPVKLNFIADVVQTNFLKQFTRYIFVREAGSENEAAISKDEMRLVTIEFFNPQLQSQAASSDYSPVALVVVKPDPKVCRDKLYVYRNMITRDRGEILQRDDGDNRQLRRPDRIRKLQADLKKHYESFKSIVEDLSPQSQSVPAKLVSEEHTQQYRHPTDIQQLTHDVKNLESQQAKLKEELSTTQTEPLEVKGELGVQKAASESLQEQLVKSECRARTAEQESQQAREESEKANQQLQTVRDEFAAVVELKDKQLDWERKELDEYKRAHRQLQSAVSKQERELDHLQEEYAQILDHHSTRKHDPTYPGVCFFGDPLQESIDSSGRLIQWPQVGITLDIPPGAVPSGEVLYLSIWPCLSGPYVLPPGFELVSPAYLIKPAFHFKKPVMLSLDHFARLSTDDDCNKMSFVSAQFSPETTGKEPEYHFRVLNKGSFRQGENVGTICVTHFCAHGVARKRKRKQEAEAKQRKDADLECSVPADVEYSLLLYNNKSIPFKHDGYAIFAVSLCHVLYLENLSKDIKEQFPGIQFWLFQKHRVQMTGDAVEVEYPQAVGRWRIEPDRKPLRISRKDVDLPYYHPELSRSKEHYPPRIHLTITSPQEGAKDAKCSLRVVGMSEHVEFLMQLKRKKQPESSETLPLLLPHSSATLGERPTLRMLLAFPAREGMLNIPDMIGTWYTQLGIFLLEDDTGAKVRTFRTQYQDRAQAINIEILTEWIHGRGKQPVIWRTLVEVLHTIGLNSLADSIAVVKC